MRKRPNYRKPICVDLWILTFGIYPRIYTRRKRFKTTSDLFLFIEKRNTYSKQSIIVNFKVRGKMK